MCGICGSVSVAGGPVDPEPVRRMLRAMVHRGPDAEGVLAADGVVAGIRRLRVIDLESGDQPIENEDGTVAVVFNGEIYNHRELRDDLRASGHRFRTASDTEVLVHLWEDHGPALLDRLHGMFALCIHDRRTRETFLARDRLGIKPLFWCRSGDTLAFASEPGVLLEHPAVSREVDLDGLVERFVLQYVPGDGTVYREVRKLPPGHVLRIAGGEVEISRWWTIPPTGPDAAGDVEAVAAELRARIADAVLERTIADVPLGMFLSGGVDSTVVLSELAKASDAPVRTYTVGFEGPAAFDERRHARLAAERFGAEHHEMVLSAEEIGGRLPDLVARTAEPVTDPALIPTWLLSEFARREVTVALTGEGADELFAGYRRYRFQDAWGWLGRVPGAGALGRVGGAHLPGRSAQALQAVAERDAVRNHLRWSAVLGEEVVDRLFGAGAFGRTLDRVAPRFRSYFGSPGDDRLAARLRADQHEWLPHDLLDKVDRASMAHSLEARTPFLDHRVVRFAATVPDRLKLRSGTGKWILRHAYREVLPRELLERPKRGFDLPLDAWIRGPLRATLADVLDDAARWPALDGAAARRLPDDHVEGRRDAGLALFNLASILLFLRANG